MMLELLAAVAAVSGAVRIWMRAGPGRIRVLAMYAGLLLVTATATGGPPTGAGRLGWLPAALTLAAAAWCAAVPATVSYLLSLALISQGLYGFVIARAYSYNSWPTRYGLLPVGGSSRLTYLVLPQAYALLALGGWLLWVTMSARPELARQVLGPRLSAAPGAGRADGRLWGLLLPLVAATAAELFTPFHATLFGLTPKSVAWTIGIGVAALLLIRQRPAIAADLAVLGLIGLGVLGIVMLSTGRPPGIENPVSDDWLYGLVTIISKSTLGLALGQAVALAALGAWLVPRTIGAQLRLHFAGGAGLEQRVQQLTQSRAIAVDSAAAELRTLERDLHDGAQARLIALGMSLSAAERLIPAGSDAALALITEARDSSAQALQELRGLVRGVHPPVLADRGLADAVRSLALDIAIPTHVDIDLPGRLEGPVEGACYFAVAEALTNAVKHSGAREIRIRLEHRRDVLRIEVIDDGTGGADPSRGTGLAGLERRLAAFDGIVAVSSPPGGPTIVAMELACALL
jgi:signal transduction histidine kinase